MTQKGLAPILIILILAALVGGYLVYQQSISKPASPPQPTTQPSPTSDPTANWKTYTNTKYGYALKYRSDWKLLEQNSNPSITNNTTGIGTNHYFNISVNVSDNTKHQTTQEFIDSAKILTASNVSNNPFSVSKQYMNGAINGIIANWSNGDDGFVEVVQATTAKIYEFKLVAGPNTGTLPTDEDRHIFDQILSTFRFLP